MAEKTEWDGLWDEDFILTYAEEERVPGLHPLHDSFNGLGYVVYKRTYARPLDEGRSEEWYETVARVISGAQAIGAGYTTAEAERLFSYIWNLKAIPGGRMLWQLGTPNNERLGGDSLVNCWYTSLSEVDDFRFLFNQLMLGGGVGFNVTPESVAKLPAVGVGQAVLTTGFDVDFIVPDNREGWGELLVRVLEANFEGGENFTYSVDAVRPEGAPIKTFGGTASGPGILIEGVNKIQAIFDRAHERLSTVDVLDIANIIGSIVVSGNVRRSAQIALGSPHDSEYLQAKRWDLGNVPNYRAMSNNTVYVEDIEDLPDEFWGGYHGNGEPYGLFNLGRSQKYGRMFEERPDYTIEGVNPCGEIPLANRESCNLAELVLPKFVDEEELIDAARLLYKMQKAVARLPFLDERTNQIAHANLRLGLGVTGVAQASRTQLEWLDETYLRLREFDKKWSETLGVPTSIRLTTVKPSGTLSLLAGVTPGVHPGYARFHVRNVRMMSSDPIVEWCREKGYPVEFEKGLDGEIDPKTVVISFPAEFPEGTLLADETDAITQLRYALFMQENWADNAVSVTITYRPEELPEIREFLEANWHLMKSVSFLPYSEHGFVQAPLIPISEEEYERRLDAIDEHHQAYIGISQLGDDECSTGACPIR